MEIVPIDLEFADIVKKIGGRRVAIKCDAQGSEFVIFKGLDASGQLSVVDAVVVETYFKEPSSIIDILSRNGFSVETRLDSEANCVYTIKGVRQGRVT